MKVILLSDLGWLKVSGQQAKDFLQGQMTCDMSGFPLTQGLHGAHCDVKGRVIFNAQIFQREESFYLCLQKTMLDKASKVLKKYAAFSRVTIEKITDMDGAYGIISDTPVNWGTQLEGISLLSQEGEKPFRYVVVCFDEKPAVLATTPMTDNLALWHYYQVMAGMASIYPQTSGVLTPHVLGYHQLGLISFSKGCYTGQEIIARMHFLGKLKEQLHLFQVTGKNEPTRGCYLQNDAGKDVGLIVDVCPGIDGGFVGLMCVRHESILEKLSWNQESVVWLGKKKV